MVTNEIMVGYRREQISTCFGQLAEAVLNCSIIVREKREKNIYTHSHTWPKWSIKRREKLRKFSPKIFWR